MPSLGLVRHALLVLVPCAFACNSVPPAEHGAGGSNAPAASEATPDRAAPVTVQAIASRDAATPEPPDPSLAGPLRFAPAQAGDGKLPHDPWIESIGEGSFASHVDEFGWNATSDAFMYCLVIGGAELPTCSFVGLDGKVETVEAAEPGTRARRELDARREDFGGGKRKGPTTWAYGKDVTITWKADRKKWHLLIGGTLASGDGKPDVIRAEFDPGLLEGGDMWPELVSVAPDGAHVVFLAHGSLGEVETILKPHVWGVGDFAAAVYAGAGWKHLNAKKYESAAESFAKAAGASLAWKHAYNLACARALGGLPGTEDALKLAVERGGAPVKAKAKTDDDLAAVRGEAWFSELVGG